MQQLRALTLDTKDRPHVVMRGLTRHIVQGQFQDRIDDHYLPVTGYDDMSTIDINRKQLGWAVVGHGNLDQIIDPESGRVRKDIVQFKKELDSLINSPELMLASPNEAQLRAEIEAELRAEFEAKIAAAAAKKVEPESEPSADEAKAPAAKPDAKQDAKAEPKKGKEAA